MRVLSSWQFWAVAFIAFVLYAHPDRAARIVHHGLGALSHAGNSLSAFVSSL